MQNQKMQSKEESAQSVPSLADSVAAMRKPWRAKRRHEPSFQATPGPSGAGVLSDAARQVARLFDVDAVVHGAGAASMFGWTTENPTTTDLPAAAMEAPKPGQIILITGPSGAGKSSLLRQLRHKHHDRNWVDVSNTATAWRDGLVIDQFADNIETGLWALGRFGLGEVRTYLSPPDHLSDGQRWRLQLALALHNAATDGMLLIDEFAAVLDRVTACIVARALRRAIDDEPTRCAVIATSHDDLERALLPDVIIRCDFGHVEVRRRVDV